MSGKPTDDELETYIADERTRVAGHRGTKTVIVMELEEVWSSKHRKRISDFEAEMEQKRLTHSLGLAVVVPNSLIRGAFTAFFWISAPKYPTKMVPRAVDAYDWVSRLLQENGLPAPERTNFERVAQGHWSARRSVPGKGMLPVNPTDEAPPAQTAHESGRS
jgi:hypothetical protein